MKKGKEKLDNSAKRRKETIIAVVVLLVASVSGNAWLGVKYFTNSSRPQRYNLLDPAREFYGKDDLIVDFQSLRDELNKMGENKNISIYFEYLNTGANISVNKDSEFWPASLMKIPLAMAVMKKIENGDWKLNNELVLFNEDKDERYGELYKQNIGARFTIEKLLEEMLINSDNTARSIFMRNIEAKEVDAVLEYLGLEDIFNTDKKVSAKRYSIFWRSLFSAGYLSPKYSEELLELTSRSSAKNYLKQGLPEEVKFSHKIGVADDVYSDSGIVYVSDRPYILTVMIQGVDQSKAEQTMKEISLRVYQYVSTR